VTVRQGDTLTLAVNGTVESPGLGRLRRAEHQSWRRHVSTAFTGYVPEKGIQLPTGIATTIDFRNVVQSKLYIDRNIVDAPIDDLSAPASVRQAKPQGPPAAGGANPQPMKVADHVWFLGGNTFLEFDDHFVMVEANRQDAALQGILKAVNSLVPGKRVTQGDPDAPSLRSQRRTPCGGRRGADDHLAARQRGHLPRNGGASRPIVPGRSRKESEAAEIHTG
jgi:hypothetical protein